MTRNCMVFLTRRELTRSAILWCKNVDSTKWPTVFLRDVKGNPCNFEACLVWIKIFNLFKINNYLSNYLYFITNGSKRFSKTNSTDPRQRVFLRNQIDILLATYAASKWIVVYKY